MSSASRSHLRFCVPIVAALLCLSLIGGFGVVGAQSASDGVFQQSPPDSADNTTETPRHQNPNDVDEDGNLDSIRQRLAAELAASLGEGSVALSEGEYELARETVGDDYSEQLSKYVELAEESDIEADNETAQQFEAAAENQREFATAAEEYEATYDEYQEAVESGDEEQARELARELQRLSEETEESGSALEENYANISESTSRDLSEERQNVATERESIEIQQQEVQELEFVGTSLEIEPPSEPISFDDPLVASGTLTDEDGDPIASEEVSFVINDRTVTTTTDEDGEFTLVYRPTVLSTDTESLEITYEPDAGSEYADTSTTVPVTVEQSQPEVTIESVTDPVAFGDDLTVTGTVEGSGESVEGVPVVVSLGDQRLGEVQTDADGSFELSTTTPGTVPAGEGTVSAELPLEDQALMSAETSVTTTVEETETQVSTTAVKTDDGQVAVSGRLATADGRAITTDSVRILVDGATVTTLETDRTGEYEGTVTPPALAGQSAEITAVYDGAGTNLADSQATDTVSGLPVAQSILDAIWLPGTILATLGLIIIGWVYRRRRQQTSGSNPLSYALGDYSGSETDGTDAETHHIPAHILIGLAHKCHQNGEDDRAIALAYTAVRNHLRTNAVPGWTHWEFYNQAAEDLDDAQRNTLLSITEQFERAVFASQPVSETSTAAVITAANQLIGSKPRY